MRGIISQMMRMKRGVEGRCLSSTRFAHKVRKAARYTRILHSCSIQYVHDGHPADFMCKASSTIWLRRSHRWERGQDGADEGVATQRRDDIPGKLRRYARLGLPGRGP